MRASGEHSFCFSMFRRQRLELKIPHGHITFLDGSNVGYWSVYIDPDGLAGAYTGCCRWSAGCDALRDEAEKRTEKGSEG